MNRRSFTSIIVVVVAFVGSTYAAVAATRSEPGIRQEVAAATELQTDLRKQGAPDTPLSPVGSAFTYQGRLRISGDPANGPHDFEFRLYDVAAGGSQVGTIQTVLSQTVTNGLFTVLLDFGPGAVQGDARWLEILVRPAGGGAYTLLSPRQALTAAPYAQSLMPGAVISGTNNSAMVTVNNSSGTGSGIKGVISNSFNHSNAGVYGDNNAGGYGVWGESSGGIGVFGEGSPGVQGRATTDAGYGVYGDALTTNGTGVYGRGHGSGVFGSSALGFGVYGNTGGGSSRAGVIGGSDGSNGIGVWGIANFGSGASGVYGSSSSGVGVRGTSTSVYGVYGSTGGGGSVAGVYGVSTGFWGIGVWGVGNNGTEAGGVYGGSTSGYGGYFDGRVHVNGTLSKSAGSFKIDHPLDPENKFLYHSFVESPDMLNIYRGQASLDAQGEAWVQMPDWFEALNRDFDYQLTAIGAPMPNLYIAEEISGNRFKIAGGKASMKVSWQVTGTRHDPYAEQHRIPVEEEKPDYQKGKYLHPGDYGQPETKGIGYERRQHLTQP